MPEKLRPYLTEHPTGKQLALIMSLPVASPALYIDSDVLFFPGAEALGSINDAHDHYLSDCQLSADERLFRAPQERHDPVNTGVLFLAHKLDWSLSLERFLELDGPPDFFHQPDNDAPDDARERRARAGFAKVRPPAR